LPLILISRSNSVVEVLSYSSGAGRSFSKGSSQKKDRKKKQEFHKHKLKFTEEEHLDFEQLKSRVTVALDKLGHQVFSLEPGGYTFNNWMTSFNLLLDDFERKAGEHLSREYYDSRLKLTAELGKPIDTSDIDPDITKIEDEIEATKIKMTELTRESNSKVEEHRKIVSQIDHFRGERVTKENELVEATETLSRLRKKKSFFSRLMSNQKESPEDSAKDKVESIQSEIDSIDGRIRELEENSVVTGEQSDDQFRAMKERFDGLQESLAELNEKKNERLQLTEKRIETTTALSGIISSLKLVETAGEETASEAEET
jgi:chromosome segregation ATPase